MYLRVDHYVAGLARGTPSHDDVRGGPGPAVSARARLRSHVTYAYNSCHPRIRTNCGYHHNHNITITKGGVIAFSLVIM